MDFFDSVVDSIVEGNSQDTDFFESILDDIIDDDSEVVTEFVSDTIAVGILIALNAIVGTVVMACFASAAKDAVNFRRAIKNYEKLNPDVIPLKKLVRKSVKVSGFNEEYKEKISKVARRFKLDLTNVIDFYYKEEPKDDSDVPVCAFQKKRDGNLIRITMYSISKDFEKHWEYYFSRYAVKEGVFPDQSKIQGWIKKWVNPDKDEKKESPKKESVDDIETESFEDEFNFADEFFTEASVKNTIMAPLSKLRATLSKKSIYSKALKASTDAAQYQGTVKVGYDIDLVVKAFTDLVDRIDGFVLEEASKGILTYSEIKKNNLDSEKKDFNEAIMDATRSTEYKITKLNSDIGRNVDVVISSCTKIAKKADKIQSREDLPVDMARLVSQAITIVNGAADRVLSIMNSCMKKYDPDKIKKSAYSSGLSTGYALGRISKS